MFILTGGDQEVIMSSEIKVELKNLTFDELYLYKKERERLLFTSSKMRKHSITLLCPFHEERTPSMRIWLDSRNYHCFGCGQEDSLKGFDPEEPHDRLDELLWKVLMYHLEQRNKASDDAYQCTLELTEYAIAI